MLTPYLAGIEALYQLNETLTEGSNTSPAQIDYRFQHMMVSFLPDKYEGEICRLCAERVGGHLSSLRLVHSLNENWDKSQMLRTIDGNSAYDILDTRCTGKGNHTRRTEKDNQTSVLQSNIQIRHEPLFSQNSDKFRKNFYICIDKE